MEVKDLESLIQITKEIEKQGYTVTAVESKECFDVLIKVLFSRKRTRPLPPSGASDQTS